MGERRYGQEYLVVCACRPQVFHAARCRDHPFMRVLHDLGQAGGAAAKHQCADLFGRSSPTAERRIGLGHQCRHRHLVSETDHLGVAERPRQPEHQLPRRGRTDHCARRYVPEQRRELQRRIERVEQRWSHQGLHRREIGDVELGGIGQKERHDFAGGGGRREVPGQGRHRSPLLAVGQREPHVTQRHGIRCSGDGVVEHGAHGLELRTQLADAMDGDI